MSALLSELLILACLVVVHTAHIE